jgi:3-oxosteroid 1-dehydrogenase
MGLEVDAGLDFMEESWGMSISPVPGSEFPYIVLPERSLAGSIIVNSAGKRFCNEAGPYIDVVNAQRNNHSEEQSAIPAYLIVDSRYLKKYPLGPIMPGASPKKHIESGYVKSADSIKGLAEQYGIDPHGLSGQMEKYNENAIHGSDPEFEKGKHPIDHYYSDPSVKPNSCVGPVNTPPYYAIEIWPGDLGTKGGLNTDEHARVLNQGGQVIEGLYATGNCSASVMGATYAGAGGTIGPSMTFGYIAAKHAVGKNG